MAIELNQQQIDTLKRELPYFSPLRKALLAGDHQKTQQIIKNLMQPAQTAQYDTSLAVKSTFVAFLLRVFCFVLAFMVKTPDTLSYRVLRSVLPDSVIDTTEHSHSTKDTEQSQQPTSAAYQPMFKNVQNTLADKIVEYATLHLELMDSAKQGIEHKERLYHLGEDIYKAIWNRFFKPKDTSDIVGSEAIDITNMVRLLAFLNAHGNNKAELKALLSLETKAVFTKLGALFPKIESIVDEHRFLFIFMLASKMLQSYTTVTLGNRMGSRQSLSDENAFHYATMPGSPHENWLEQLMVHFLGIPYQNPTHKHMANKPYLENIGNSLYLSIRITTVDIRERVIEKTRQLHGEKSPVVQYNVVI